MCLIGLALDAHPRWAVVIAANRDEFFDRPAAPLDWWRTGDDAPWLLGGRDLGAGGTWMGLSSSGRVGMLTNMRDPARHRPDAPSRGALVTDWLERGAWPSPASANNPFNLIGGDLHQRRWWWTSDRHAEPAPLAAGVHALSNGALNEPWPKVHHLSTRLRRVLDDRVADDRVADDRVADDRVADDDVFVEHLFALLADDRPAPDDALPDTGIGLDRERQLSPAFIRWPEAAYGTRCSTVVLGRADDNGHWRVLMHERSHDRNGRAHLLRHVNLKDWPHNRSRAPVESRALS